MDSAIFVSVSEDDKPLKSMRVIDICEHGNSEAADNASSNDSHCWSMFQTECSVADYP